MTAAVIGFPTNECITGTVNGNLFLWKDSQAQRPLQAHNGKVTSLCSSKNVIYSAGLDGKVIVYQLKEGAINVTNIVFETARLFKSSLIDQRPQTAGIISMDI
jgi:WD40 repeat protein